uniref:Uncharacterized protein n=1 Tax=Mucochytrium quahogii TaxID=96639 RepID=A0A7S2WS29_9STRA|mmetsp:Transcript_10338/g.16875  ORF Transcript_10338/g.16875 Transcript_10338/m.16875 type:complete len:129 (+) Transcript_10338:42-428(+)|eukprot:CAMPEP_0203770776 /NCGR_PEP_ID=MMETSP0099_2-20121227/3033_1 /ASSEMBLY_ACC=CAM_ASM_000209 /TAXON_ID=96639 /ORGANISM=" , Strain NY0313808BC1" /LENGTH=128 /DNA_ID=CAMNT_0050668019 /DNA_START=227 /DNA_END=613 /DNA_ORIENTATION=+
MDQAQKKLAEIQAELGGKEVTQENVAALERQKQQQKEMINDMLTRICTPDALDRLKRVGIVKPEIVDKVQNSILQAAQSGQLQGRVDEDQVKGMLAKAGADKAASGKVVIQRKTYFDEDSDDNDDDLL